MRGLPWYKRCACRRPPYVPGTQYDSGPGASSAGRVRPINNCCNIAPELWFSAFPAAGAGFAAHITPVIRFCNSRDRTASDAHIAPIFGFASYPADRGQAAFAAHITNASTLPRQGAAEWLLLCILSCGSPLPRQPGLGPRPADIHKSAACPHASSGFQRDSVPLAGSRGSAPESVLILIL